jgi:hypothetical protein
MNRLAPLCRHPGQRSGCDKVVAIAYRPCIFRHRDVARLLKAAKAVGVLSILFEL